MIGKQVVSLYGENGVVLAYEPLGSAMTDTLVQVGDKQVWVASHMLRFACDGSALPCRRVIQEEARQKSLTTLQKIRDDHIRSFHQEWPGLEFGKALFGQSLDAAIADLTMPASANEAQRG